MKRLLALLWKHLWCRFFHERCWPEVWGHGLDGPWNCVDCHPCGEEIDRLIAMLDEFKTKQ